MDPMDEIKQMFFVECDEHLEALQEGLEALKQRPEDIETVNTVFRAVHSIKGGAAAFSLGGLVEFAHSFETTLDEIRSGRLATSDEVLRTLLRSADLLNDLVSASRADGAVDPDRVNAQIAALAAAITGNAAAPVAASEPLPAAEPLSAAPTPVMVVADAPTPPREGVSRYRITFRPHGSLFERGNEPALILRELGEIGEVVARCDTASVPPLDEFDPTDSYLGWEIDLTSEEPEKTVQEIFEFVEGDCELTVRLYDPDEDAPIDGGIPSGGEAATIERAGPEQEHAADSQPTPKAVVAKAKPADVDANAQSGGRNANATVRVDLDRVDRLINLVGELVINQAMLSQSVVESGLANSSAIAAGLDEFKHLTREVQESVLAIRAQPVKALFQRMARIVREAADATGKSVRFLTDGEMTEVDKTVIERLADPLTHMIRNSVDHGLESPDKRTARGKSPEGIVRLTAEHRSGRVLIEITDDGAGIDRERVQQIAVEKGLISSDSVLSTTEIDNLLFLPGFSTAKVVSDLSGRGVGMDVVRRSIAGLGGRISISSQPGEGTCFSISLPLTLAILDGMVVSIGSETIVVPLSAILEMLKPDSSQIHPLGPDQDVLHVRGEFVPIIDVGYQLGFTSKVGDYMGQVILLIETSDGERRALVVSAIQDQRQVVIKGIEENYGQVSGIAAATILGDGRIALILDTDAVVSDAARDFAANRNTFALAG